MDFDEEIISLVRGLPAVQSICVGKLLYHLQVLQDNPGSINFPAIVYNMVSNTPFGELDEANGMYKADFEFDCYSKLSADIRNLQFAIYTLNQTIGTVLEWIEVAETTDNFDPPIDLDEMGLKAVQMTVTVYYRLPVTTTTTTPAP